MNFNELRKLKPNWDSYGALPIDERCIDKADEILGDLWGNGEYSIVPCSDGGVQLEQHANGLDIEISISPAREERR